MNTKSIKQFLLAGCVCCCATTVFTACSEWNDHYEGTADEYNVNTFVYYRRRPFNKDRFVDWCEHNEFHIIRAKGILYFDSETQNAYVYESAGRQQSLAVSGQWYSETLSKRQLKYLINNDENFAHDWDEKYGDKLIKLVFIGQNLDKVNLKKELDLL